MSARDTSDAPEATDQPADFIRQRVAADVAAGKNGGKVVTRFPPEPNGYLHIGHAKAICLNFGIAEEFGGVYNLRFDDTNPAKEDVEFQDAIERDIRWLGFDWGDRLFHASDYFERLYACAEQLIQSRDAYVDSLSAEEIRKYRGTLQEPGRDSPHRTRSVEENLKLFRGMRAGEFPDGAHVLRAKIDMTSGNINMRDPTLYRIRRIRHHRTGDAWCIYPSYDFAHGQSDAFEGVTHSLCTLEFEDHRPLYDWLIEHLKLDCHPQQIEYAKLTPSYMVTSKRKLRALVEDGLVTGWDDPRMPTLSAMRRRGYTPAAIRDFIARLGVGKSENRVEIAQLEYSLRQDLNRHAPRRMAVLDPLRVVIENYPEGQTEELDAINNPEDEAAGKRKVPFSRVLYIERADFMEEPPRKFFRLGPGREVRLRYAYFITCTDVVKDDAGNVVELRCSYDPATKGGDSPDGRKVKGTLHWVSAEHAIDAEVRLYDRLFNHPNPTSTEKDGIPFTEHLNPESLVVVSSAKLEPSLADAEDGVTYQFERLGYFCKDATDSKPGRLVINRTVTLRDTWARLEKARQQG